MSVAEPEIITPMTPEYADDILPARGRSRSPH